ncbi:MAG: CPBP family intramembrane metalloprotease [Chloroflexi bacterium]|nr:CPBP family intramembrane metalloprotease [Chloroflexota bacterium]
MSGPALNCSARSRRTDIILWDIKEGSMETKVDRKRIIFYLSFAFGIAWLAGLAIYLTGGIAGSPSLIPGTNINLAVVLVVVLYMPAPALANVLTRLLTHEGWQNTYLRINFKRAWPYWLATWFGPALLTGVGLLVYFLIFPQYFDPQLGVLNQMIQQQYQQLGQTPPDIGLWTIVFAQTAQAVLIAPILNALPTFGEEFGWRAYLQPKLMPLGARKAILLMGVIWGVWHWPIIAMGHNYGLAYPGYPWAGMLMMVWFTFIVGTFLGWAAFRSASVWPAVIGHAALNGIAGIGVYMTQGDPNPLIGPMPVGILGSVGFAVLAAILYFSPRAFAPVAEATHPEAVATENPPLD